MHKIGIILILPGLLIGIQSLPSSLRRHHVTGRSSAQLSSLNLQKNDLANHHAHHREPREIRMLRLHDPLDCLSQVVCGMNTYPPQKPTVRTSTANDFAFLLKNSVAKLRSSQPTTTTTSTTAAPITKRTSTTKAPLDDDEDEDDYEDDDGDGDYEADGDDVDDYEDDDKPSPAGRRRSKRYSIFNKRRGEIHQKSEKSSKKENSRDKKSKKKNNQPFKKFHPTTKPLTALDRLKMETDLRAKLLSDAQCINGLQDHSCPFNYQQMLVLISSALERERTISYSSSKVLPMVGYLIKSRNYTGTLQATFSAIEKINNYTIEADRDAKPIDFTHILDEVMNRVSGDSGLRIVDTSNDSASASVWEDDEFDQVLQNPYERRRPQSDNYKLKAEKKKELLQQKIKQQQLQQKQKVSGSEQAADDDDQSTTSEEDTSEEGLVFDRQRPPPGGGGPPPNGPGESSSEEDEVNQEDNAKVEEKKKAKEPKKKKKITGTGFGKQSSAPGPVFGFSHLQKSAEDE